MPGPGLSDSESGDSRVLSARGCLRHMSIEQRGSKLPPELRCTVADDDAGGHGVAGRHARHDRAVRDAKVFDSIDLKLGVYDGRRIAPHLGSTRLMPVRSSRIANEVF